MELKVKFIIDFSICIVNPFNDLNCLTVTLWMIIMWFCNNKSLTVFNCEKMLQNILSYIQVPKPDIGVTHLIIHKPSSAFYLYCISENSCLCSTCLSYPNVKLEGSDSFIQNFPALLLTQLNAVHSAPVQLLKAMRTCHAREWEECHTIFGTKSKGLLGNFS